MRRSSTAAFTLVELIFVMLIISLLSVLAVNSYLNARFKALLKSESEKVVEVIRATAYEVRKGDVAEAQCRSVSFKQERATLEIMTMPYSRKGCDFKKQQRDQTITLADPVFVSNLGTGITDAVVVFTPPEGDMMLENGQPERPARAEISVQFGGQDGPGWTRTVELDTITGTIRLLPLSAQ